MKNKRPNYDAVFLFGEEGTVLSEEEVEEIGVTEEFEGRHTAEMKKMVLIFKHKPTFSLARRIWVHCQDQGFDVPADVHKEFVEGIRKQIVEKEDSKKALFLNSPSFLYSKSEHRIAIQIAIEECLKNNTPTKCFENLAREFGTTEWAIKEEKYRMDQGK
ncbi:MAG: hypothetical protein KJ804_01430 [Proteobacteria bacterium]|nr:hypothetical protein [Pseudomonadota bacterium]